MEYAILGKTDLVVSRIGFGGAEIGHQKATQIDVDELLNSALDAGLTLIDTAAAYWKSEEMIGNALGARRNDVVLMSKCGALDGFTQSDWSKNGILEAIENSLRLLKTDHLDIAQLHSCSREILAQGDCIEGLIRAQEKGHTRFLGYSGDGEDAKFAVEMDFFDTLQTSVSIVDQEAIELTIPIAAKKKMGIIAKRPIANAVWLNEELPEDPYHQEYWNRIQALEYPFLNGSTSKGVAHALRFTLSVAGISAVIVGTTKRERWKENAEMQEQISFDQSDFDYIRERWEAISEGKDWKGEV